MTADAGTAGLTLLALLAFASNSILTRLALGAHQIDAASFTAVRLVSGAVALALVVRITSGGWSSLRTPSIPGAFTLLAYAAPFSLAYVRIGAAVGALVLFGVVQLTMVGYAVTKGDRLPPLAWAGLGLASGGLVLLTVRSDVGPDPAGLLLMALAGAAWAAYSIAGRTATAPVISNARNFVWSAPLALLLPVVSATPPFVTTRGVLLAAVSGAITSGLGYAVWYRALRQLQTLQAAVAQLCVPVIAAAGSVLLLGESVNMRLAVSSAAVLGGIALVLVARHVPFRRV